MMSSSTLIPDLSRRTMVRLGAGAALLAGSRLDAALAQEATPASDAEAPGPAVLSMVQYIHPEKVYFWVPGFADDDVRAGLYGLDAAALAGIEADYAAAARGAAEALLTDEAFAARVDRLPFAAGDVVAVIGESDTDSLQSWFEIVRHLVELRRPDDGIQFINSGVSAMTTTQAFGPFMPILVRQSAWIICALGANDAVRIGPEPNQTLVSLDETLRNLAELRRLAGLTTEAEWVWLTRMPLDEVRLNAYEPFAMGPLAHIWRNADLDPINAWILEQPELVVDYHVAFGDPVPPEFQEPDGLHPTLAGHQAVAREFVQRLAG